MTLNSKEKGNGQELIQLNTTPDLGHHILNLKKTHTRTRNHPIKENQEASRFAAGDEKVARNTQDSVTYQHKAKNPKEDSQKKNRSGTVSKIFTGGLKHV